MAQYGLPITDTINSNWSEGDGDGDGDAFDELDEGFGAGRGSGSGPDDITTYWLTTNEGSNQLNNDLNNLTDPVSSINHFVRVRRRKNASAGRQLDATIFLNGTARIFTDEDDTDIGAVWGTYTHNLTGGEADAITDYTGLLIGFQIIETGGGSPRVGWYSAGEFECPDVAGGRHPFYPGNINPGLRAALVR